jgi:hypothetical protein
MVRSEPPPRRPPFNKGGSKARNNKHSVMANNTATNTIVSACLLGKLSKLGDGHRQAAKRRAWAKHENEKRVAAMRAHWAANVLGRGVNRNGRFVLPW